MHRRTILALTTYLLAACAVRSVPTPPTPTFVYVYSDNWVPWTRTRPIVDRLVSTYSPCITAIEANYSTAEGRQVAHTYGVKSHPVVMVIAADGRVVVRVNGVPDADALVDALDGVCT